jgi:hypothetical protein
MRLAVALTVPIAAVLVAGSAPLVGAVGLSQPTWSQLSPSMKPSARKQATMAFDPASGQLVLFGGTRNGVPMGDTWIWTGSTWTQQSPNTSPSARYGTTMAFDPATGQLILFGGFSISGG